MMNDSLAADARRFRLSLAASACLNIGLLVLAAWLDPLATLSRPQARPHLRMVAFAIRPAPPASSRRGIESASRLTAATTRLPPQQPRSRQARRLTSVSDPPARLAPVREAAVPRSVLRIVTAKRLSVRAVSHPVALDRPVQALPRSATSLPVRLPAPLVSITAAPAISVTVPPPPVPAAASRAAGRQESSRGGWQQSSGIASLNGSGARDGFDGGRYKGSEQTPSSSSG